MYKSDQNIQNRLSDFEYEFRPEYWDNMEQKLNDAGSSSNGSVSKFGKLSGLGPWGNLFVYTSVISLLVTSVYIGIGFNQDEKEPIAKTSFVANENDCGEVNEFNLSIQSNVIAEELDDINTDIHFVENRSAKQLHNNVDGTNLMMGIAITNPSVENLSTGIILEELAEIDTIKSDKTNSEIEKDTYVIPDAQYVNDDNRSDTVAKAKMRVIVKEEKDKKPMQRPNKKVFKKRKGLLYYLGLRR